jgi:predicted metal-dependent hydrolase
MQHYLEKEGDEREAYLEGLSPDQLLDLGIELYEAGHYWNAHEAWEQVWMDAPNEVRLFYQGLIQVTAAFVHVTKGEYPGSVRLLIAAIEKLEAYEPERLGVDVSGLLDQSRRALRRLLDLDERRIGEFDMGLAPKIRREKDRGTR